jgi:hypothetical protein
MKLCPEREWQEPYEERSVRPHRDFTDGHGLDPWEFLEQLTPEQRAQVEKKIKELLEKAKERSEKQQE